MPTAAEIEFESQWKSGESPPDIFAFLAERGVSGSTQQLPVVLLDQHHRWQRATPLTVEQYVAQLPDVAQDNAARLELVLNEYRLRQSSNDAPTIAEFVGRFSDLAATLRTRLLTEQTIDAPATDEEKTLIERAPAELVGRYRLGRVLGMGAYGCVYLGFDEELQRAVAVKVPHAERFERTDEAESFLTEARLVAGLDHPHIVPVHDVGRTTDGAIYIVSKYISGVTLKQKLASDQPSIAECVRLLIPIAEALHHAHQRQLIHRDVKPGNVLIDHETDHPYITDFGLAVRDQDLLANSLIAGTPSYMSPEQARGEGHRLTSRSDVFALGAILYRMLTGFKAFAGATTNEILHQVVSEDPPAPTTVAPNVPPELERICGKAMNKRVSDRYASAHEMAEELRHWQSDADPVTPVTTRAMVPHGLRSFDSNDADFFWQLLPGTRNRDGVPDSVQFWISRLEETDADATFSVGLIYGPSGCGKSSLMKAGVLPHLSSNVKTVYLEATHAETELRILRGIRKRHSSLPQNLDLVRGVQWLRQQGGSKTLIVIDQFEQWLHVGDIDVQCELIRAFRQCDGASVQAVVMIRDDFAMAAARFMDALDIPIIQGTNFATVDLFDEAHAVQVLSRFGQAFGKLPPHSSDFTDAQTAFLQSVARGLAKGGQVVPVQLALFAEMVKKKAWDPSTLDDVGGTTGVGVNFLEETFHSRSANPAHRKHKQAARDVLQALLPEVGSDIKGHMRSHEELLELSGYRDSEVEFNDLLRVLDGDLRLITPTDPEGFHSDSGSGLVAKHYQLTHDYLVPSLRDWLTRRQQSSRSGRAELRLAERVSLWSAHRESRQLPSLLEWQEIRRLVPPEHWSPDAHSMMAAATARYVSHLVLVACVVLAVGLGAVFVRSRIQTYNENNRIDQVVNSLWRATPDHLPAILADLDGATDSWREPVMAVAKDTTADPRRRIRAWLALGCSDPAGLPDLAQHLRHCSLAEQAIILERISPFNSDLAETLWKCAEADSSPLETVRLSCALAQVDADSPRWKEYAAAVAQALVECDALFANEWLPQLVTVLPHLGPELERLCLDSSSRDSSRLLAASLVAAFHRSQPEYPPTEQLRKLVMGKEAYLRETLATTMKTRRDELLPTAIKMASQPIPNNDSPATRKQINRATSAALVAFQLGHDDPFWQATKQVVDPRVRTELINRFSETGITSLPPPDEFDRYPATVRQAMLLGLQHIRNTLDDSQRSELVSRALDLCRVDPDAGAHAAAAFVLRTLGGERQLNQLLKTCPHAGNWSVLTNGLCMVKFDAPGMIELGATAAADDSDGLQPRRTVVIDYPFAISATEVTVRQMQQRLPSAKPAAAVSHSDDTPMNLVSLFDAMKFCRLLSEQEPGFSADRCCYPPVGEIGPDMQLQRGFLKQPGYRLPSVHEWEYVVRAESVTSRFFGNSPALLDDYAWWVNNSEERQWPVGTKRPNPWGLFDVFGNALEWCHEAEIDFVATGHPVRGGDYRGTQRFLRSSFADYSKTGSPYAGMGFRIVKIAP